MAERNADGEREGILLLFGFSVHGIGGGVPSPDGTYFFPGGTAVLGYCYQKKRAVQ